VRTVALTDSEEDLARLPTYGERFLFLRRRSALRGIDRVLGQFAGEFQFAVYLPSTRNFLMQFLATHRRCAAVHFLEEGLMTYTGEALKPRLSQYTDCFRGRIMRWLKQLDHGNRSLCYFDLENQPDPITFTVSEELRSDLPTHRVCVLEKLVVPDIPQRYVLSGATVFFMDPIVEQGMTSLDSVVQLLLNIGKGLDGNDRLWIKWHPTQRLHPCIMDSLNRHGLHYEVIPASVAPESLLLRSRGLSVFGFSSSLLYYAALWGHRAVSLIKVLETMDSGFAARHAQFNLPAAFYRRVTMPTTLAAVDIREYLS
jgi:hypothetical protein